ncbi:MAG: hypothetical protein ABI671_14125 [Burkholderiales bacterium]
MSQAIANLFGDLSDFGTTGVKATGGTKVDPKARFIANCMADVAMLNAGEPHGGSMFLKRDPSIGEGYVVTLRTGVKKISLAPGVDFMICPTKEQTIAFLTRAAQATRDGVLDEKFVELGMRYAKV